MLLKILLLSLVLSLTYVVGTDSMSSPKQGLEGGLESLVERLEFRLREMEKRMHEEKENHTKEKEELEARLESKLREMEARQSEELAEKMKKERKMFEKREREREASISKLKLEVEESLRNFSNDALTKPSLRDLPIVIISAWQPNRLSSPQTVTFERFLANYNNGERPGGGDGVLDLDSGIFTCITPGYYTVSFSAHANVGVDHVDPYLILYKNGIELPESKWHFWTGTAGTAGNFGPSGSRILVGVALGQFA